MPGGRPPGRKRGTRPLNEKNEHARSKRTRSTDAGPSRPLQILPAPTLAPLRILTIVDPPPLELAAEALNAPARALEAIYDTEQPLPDHQVVEQLNDGAPFLGDVNQEVLSGDDNVDEMLEHEFDPVEHENPDFQDEVVPPVPPPPPADRRWVPKKFCAVKPYIEMTIPPYDLGPMDTQCEHCHASHFLDERLVNSSRVSPKFNLCCQNNQVLLDPYHPPPLFLQQLLTRQLGAQSTSFLANIRKYNNALSFTSLGCKDVTPNYGAFKVQGALYHRHGSLLPDIDGRSRYAQIYFVESRPEQLAIRQQYQYDNDRNSLDPVILADLQAIMYDVNPFVRIYDYALNQLRQAPTRTLRLKADVSGIDRRRYNAPQTAGDEVAAIICDDESPQKSFRDIVLRLRGGPLQRIDETNANYDPLSYPIMFCHGDLGWDITLRRVNLRENQKNTKVTARDYIQHRIFIRGQPVIHLYGKLFQQFIVDAWLKVETNDLDFYRHNQDKLRVENYRGFSDAIRDGRAGADIGSRVRIVLPSSKPGSPRQIAQNYQDAMAIVRRDKKPDIFLTFTCNSNWPEIQRNLLPGQTAFDRPDLCVRVFRAKVRELLNYIIKDKIFGDIKNLIYTVEFQKRGLPHIHLLCTLADNCKLRTAEDVDRLICAEIPDPVNEPRLHAIVTQCLLHGPCGMQHQNSPCWDFDKKICTKKYPKSFVDETSLDIDGYPNYRRRDNGQTVTKGRGQHAFTYDNRWVVPYNKFLTARFEAHINVEVCTTVKSIKYIYKYIHKGPDRAIVANVDPNAVIDEIKEYVDARYCCATEAVWRSLSYPMEEQFPNVVRLDVHLPNEQAVYFDPDRQMDLNDRLAESSLTAWFKYNAQFTDARNIKYQDFPTTHTYDRAKRKWSRRVKKPAFGLPPCGRIYQVSPSSGELYFLRLLLLHRPGAKSFDDLKTIDPEQQPLATFKEACLRLGLLMDDQQNHLALQEVSSHALPKAIREFFVSLLIYSLPANPLQLWMEFRNQMSEDFLQMARLRDPQAQFCEAIYQKALAEIDLLLSHQNKSLASFNLPELTEVATGNRLLTEESSYDMQKLMALVDENVPKLNESQRAVYDAVLHSVTAKEPAIYFLDGPGGSGKTFTYSTILATLRSQGKICLATASSGIAAILLQGGRTAHSRFAIPLSLNEGSKCSISKNTLTAELIQRSDLIIIDEAPMLHRFALEAMDFTFRDILGVNAPFGGKVILLGGDFRQCLPVVRRALSESDYWKACLKWSNLWPQVRTFHLTTNMRVQGGNPFFANDLLLIGDGKLQDRITPGPQPKTIYLPYYIKCCSNLDKLIDLVFGDLNNYNPLTSGSRCILAARNDEVNFINSTIFAKFPGNPIVYLSNDSVEHPDHAPIYPVEYLNSLSPSSLPPHRLELKEGCVVILLRNLNPAGGLCNGTRLIVDKLHPNSVEGRILNGSCAGKTVFIPRIELITDDKNDVVCFRRRQFPLRLAWSLTITKSQGQSLNCVGIYLPDGVFSHGMLYVALSRATNSDFVFCCINYDHANRRYYTKNIVYKQVLNR